MPSLCFAKLSSRGCGALCALIAIPLLPEYFAPVLAVLSLILTLTDCRREGRPLRTGVLAPYLTVYIVYTAAGALYSENPLSCGAIAAMWLLMVCVYFSLVNLLTTRERLLCFLQLLTLAVGLMGLMACVEYLVNLCFPGAIPLQFWDPLDEWVYRLSPIPIHLKSAGLRVGATFSNPNIFAEAMVMVLPFSLYCVTGAEKPKQRYLYLGCLLLGVIGTMFSFSRGSFFALFAMTVAYIVLNLGYILHNRRLLISVLCGVLLILVFLTLIPNPITDRLETLDSNDVSIRERIRIWNAGATVFWSRLPENLSEVFTLLNVRHLLFGIGAGTENTTRILLQAGVAGAPHLHNLFLQLLAEGGVISLGLIVALILRMAWTQIWLRFHGKQAYFFFSTMLTMLCGSMLFSLVEFLFLCPKLVGIFLMCAALSDAADCCLGNGTLRPLPQGLIPLCGKRTDNKPQT